MILKHLIVVNLTELWQISAHKLFGPIRVICSMHVNHVMCQFVGNDRVPIPLLHQQVNRNTYRNICSVRLF